MCCRVLRVWCRCAAPIAVPPGFYAIATYRSYPVRSYVYTDAFPCWAGYKCDGMCTNAVRCSCAPTPLHDVVACHLHYLEGRATMCPAGRFSDVQASSCSYCTAGYYCPLAGTAASAQLPCGSPAVRWRWRRLSVFGSLTALVRCGVCGCARAGVLPAGIHLPAYGGRWHGFCWRHSHDTHVVPVVWQRPLLPRRRTVRVACWHGGSRVSHALLQLPVCTWQVQP